MALNHCGTYSTDTYCSCYNQQGVYKDHFKQFNTEAQVYECCNQINNSLAEIKKESYTGISITGSTLDFFKKLNTGKLTGCCFRDFGTTDSDFTKNYPDLFNDYSTVKALFNHFIYDKNLPTMSADNQVSCPGTNYPVILEYKSPDQIYYQDAYICTDVDNNVFNNIKVNYGNVDYRIKRFWNSQTGSPCIDSTCQIPVNNFGDHLNQGNQYAVYENKPKPNKTVPTFNLVLAALFMIIWLLLYFTHRKTKIEDTKGKKTS